MLREGLLQYWWMLYRHSKILGQRTDIYRNLEDSYAVKQADACLSDSSIYLDIGSGSSLVPTFLHQRHGALTFATELDPVYLERQRDYAAKLALPPSGKFQVVAEDATQLNFVDGSLDLITAISIIEHIPGDGDTRAMAEFARVLRPGGRVVVTVPASPQYVEADSTWYYYGFERRYDPPALQARLYRNDLNLIDQLHMVPPPEKFVTEVSSQFREIFDDRIPLTAWYENTWHDLYPDISILLSLGMIRLSPDPTGSFGAMLTFEKR